MLPHFSAKLVRGGGRSYFVTDRGDRVPSVTTILNATKPEADRAALRAWRQRVGATEAQRISTTASRRGTGTHKQIQRYLLGQSVDCSDAVLPYWESVRSVLDELDRVQLVEGFVAHAGYGYGGRVDCIASFDGVPCVCEWKTADTPRGNVERLRDAPLQLAAYSVAANEIYRDYGLEVYHALVAVALPDRPAELFWFDTDALGQHWDAWDRRLQQYWELVER
ncbi:hypothetical protein KR51_00008570 [Rubidibacter lacunae KORDI 51-2]|uniref:Exonuclease n=1 Tax=Rubidibacter lacunae KORDI 51-2 TaxID=582515 RepID=U5DNV2_9CHRO|nr:PD-(D/E)XK nuclease family protein [Rubidibacter lacunae]ERN42537.1 hypothetical protein KR51_00008570 [Rubidibacter lacunae KORDI 51-2]